MKLSQVGLGTFPFAGVFTQVSKKEATAIVEEFVGMGGNYIETAPIYAFGAVEELLGDILQSIPRDRYYLSSKSGYIWDDQRQVSKSGRYQDVIDECEKSLGRLKVDCIDIYMSHIPDTETPFDETMDALIHLRNQGKIRSIGVSNVTLEQLMIYNRGGEVKLVQNRFSLLNRTTDTEFSIYCQEHNIGLVPYQIIERGLLTDKVIEGFTLRDGDLRQQKPEFEDGIRKVIGEWVKDCLKPIADDLQAPVVSLAIWWTLQQPSIAVGVCGATSREQVKTNFSAIGLSPPTDTLQRVEKAYQTLVDQVHRDYSKTVREFMGLV